MKKSLDEVLGGWNASHKMSEEDAHALQQQIHTRIVEDRFVGAEKPGRPSRLTYGLSALAGACACLLVLGARSFWSASKAETDLLALTNISEEYREGSSLLFKEVSALFDGLNWVATDGHALEMGLQQESVKREMANPVHLKMVMVSRAYEGAPWRRVWVTEIVTGSEELVELNVGGSTDSTISVWVFSNEDGTYSVESNLSLNVPVRVMMGALHVVEVNQPDQLMALRAGEEEYRVYQSVAPFIAEAG